MNLKEYLSKKDNNADELLVRCGSCQNALVHGGKYEIVQLGQVEGVLCETCKHTDRKMRIATKVSDDGKRVIQIPVENLLLEPPKKQQPSAPATTNNKKVSK